MYKSIIFDLGGVMVDFDPRAYLVDRICNAEIEEQVYNLTFGSEEWKQLDAGLCFRPLSPAPELRHALVWKRYTVFSKAAETFLRTVREGSAMKSEKY